MYDDFTLPKRLSIKDFHSQGCLLPIFFGQEVSSDTNVRTFGVKILGFFEIYGVSALTWRGVEPV